MRTLLKIINRIRLNRIQIQGDVNTLRILVIQGILLLSVSITFSQSSDYKNTSDIWHEPLIKVEPSIEPELKKADLQFNDQQVPGYTMILDSVYEEKNFGYYSELYHWYYSYTDKYKLDTVGRYFYNGKGEIQKITESRKYNSSGQLLKLVRRQPDFEMMDYYGDSTIIDYYTEEYKYQDGKLIWEKVKTRQWGQDEITENYYSYDEEGKLIKDSTIHDYGSSVYNYVYTYFYNSSNELEYKVGKYDSIYGNVEKYTYEETDTTLLLTINNYYIQSEIEYLVLDTFSYWYAQNMYFITFDESGRRKSYTSEYEDIYWGRSIESRAVYDYTEQDDILHISYYDWVGTLEEGQWKEAMRIDNTYDEDGNILLYEKTIYDARTEEWIIDNRKEYYYTPVSSALSGESIELSGLNLYPNPAHDYLYLKDTFDPISVYSVYNLCGTIVIKDQLKDGIIDISTIKPGLYLITIETQSGVYSGKFVKY